MTVQKLCDELTILCHNGHAQSEVGIRILDAFYKVGEIDKTTIYHEDSETELFTIEARR